MAVPGPGQPGGMQLATAGGTAGPPRSGLGGRGREELEHLHKTSTFNEPVCIFPPSPAVLTEQGPFPLLVGATNLALPGGHAQLLLRGHKAAAIPPYSEFAGQTCQPLLSNMPTVGTWAFWLLRFTSERRRKCCVY